MDQNVPLPKRRRIKDSPNNSINQEETIGYYKRFFYKNLQHVKNRTKALTDLEQLCKKYQDHVGSNVAYSTISLEIEADKVLKEHFDQGVFDLFKKEIKVDFVPSSELYNGFWGLFLYSLTQNTEKSKMQTIYRSQFLKFLFDCFNSYGLHKYINDRDVFQKRYNVVLHFNDSNNSRNNDEKMLISLDKLNENYLIPYKSKAPLMINGKLIPFNKLISIQITSTLLKDDEFYLLGLQKGWNWTTDNKNKYGLISASKDETDDLISNPFLPISGSPYRISQQCIDALSKLKSPNFNFKKLNELVQELNSNMSKGNYYSVSMIIRAIIDHVPPLFEVTKFSEYANSHNKPSVKSMMLKLNETSRKIADISLHDQIGKKELILTQTQVNVFVELETLLNEIISEYK